MNDDLDDDPPDAAEESVCSTCGIVTRTIGDDKCLDCYEMWLQTLPWRDYG